MALLIINDFKKIIFQRRKRINQNLLIILGTQSVKEIGTFQESEIFKNEYVYLSQNFEF